MLTFQNVKTEILKCDWEQFPHVQKSRYEEQSEIHKSIFWGPGSSPIKIKPHQSLYNQVSSDGAGVGDLGDFDDEDEHTRAGILRPLANPETLKNLPMWFFEKPAYGNGHAFK